MADTSGLEPADGAAPDPVLPDIRRLVEEHYRSLYSYALRLSCSHADAEDLTQQAFLIAHAKLHQLRDAAKANRWLFAILRSCFLKSVGRPRAALVDSLDQTVEDRGDLPWETRAIDQEELQVALQELAEEYRVVVLMFYFEELSYKEIAEQLQIPIGTVMSRLSRAKIRLRERLFRDPMNSTTHTSPREKSRPQLNHSRQVYL